MESTEAASLSVKQLKEILVTRGVDFSDCFEKNDLIRRVQETAHLQNNKSPTYPSQQQTTYLVFLFILLHHDRFNKGGIRDSKQKLGDLDCVIVDNTQDSLPELVT